MELFREQDTLLTPKGVASHRLIGQLFETCWLIEYEGCLYIIDQRAAHEKVMYERLLASLENKTFTSQMVSPPIILTLRMQEAALLEKYMEEFQRIGFEISQFGGHDYAISAVPGNFFDFTDAELFTAMLDSLGEASGPPAADLLLPHLATMACKSAVKGNTRMSAKEADALIAELLTLKDPYNCPHGRPTIIRMTKQELEKKFHRIV
jgi:DNA mismatch repair protein MutL